MRYNRLKVLGYVLPFIMGFSPLVQAETPRFQGELDITNTVEHTEGQSYRVDGRFMDGSVIGFDGDDVATNDLIFTENVLGDVDVWQITNIVSQNSLDVSVDVGYLPSGETSTVGVVVGVAAICTLSTNSVEFPQRPSSTGARVSEHMLNEIRNYSLRKIQELLWISASNTVVYTNDSTYTTTVALADSAVQRTELGGYASTGDMVTAEGRLDVLETNTVDRTGARGMQADLNMGGFSVTNVGTNSFTFSDGVEITSTKIQLYDTFETGKINVGSSGTTTNLGDYNNDAGFITSGEADTSGWSGYSATQLINRVTTSSIPTLTSLVSDFSDTASGAGWTFDNDYAYGEFPYPSPSGETISFTMTGLFHSATSAVPDGTISGIEFCQENGSSGWYFTPDTAEGTDIEGSVTVAVWFVCGTITSDVQTVWTNGTFGPWDPVLNCGPFGSSNDLWGANLSGVSVSDISNITFHVEMSLYPTTTNGIAQFFLRDGPDKLIPETRFWFYEDETHTFGIDDDGIFKIDDSPALTNMTFGMTDSTAYRGDWGLAVSNIAVAGSNLAYSASTNAEEARTIATNADAAAGVAYSAATNAQAVAEAELAGHELLTTAAHGGIVADDDERLSDMVPVGSMTMYWGTNAPSGWLLMQGQSVSTSIYSRLYSACGTTFTINGTNMIIPDMRGKIPIGLHSSGTFNSLIKTGGVESVTLTVNQIPSHRHGIVVQINSTGWGTGWPATGNSSGEVGTNSGFCGYIGGGASHDNMPPYMVVNYIIKY